MTGTDRATPRPWRTPNKLPRQICDARGFKIAKCLQATKGANFVLPDGEAEANAALIVRSVNNYDKAVELLREADEIIAHLGRRDGDAEQLSIRIRAALGVADAE